MHRLTPYHSAPVQRQRGVTLIESLVAIVVTALGILGILGVQMRTLADTSTTVRRAQAIRLIEDLSERMKVNPNALAGINSYVSVFGNEPTVPASGCATGCSQTDLITYDLAVWKKTVRDTLPLGKAALFVPPAEAGLPAGQGRQLGIMIAWRENERDTSVAYKDDIDATKIRAEDGSLSAGAGAGAGATAACPADHTCHLQYIPVASRCPPDSNFPGQYFCAGS